MGAQISHMAVPLRTKVTTQILMKKANKFRLHLD